MAGPFVRDRDPDQDSTGNPEDTFVSLSILDADGDLKRNSLQIRIEGRLAYDGPSDSFIPPFDGPESDISPISTFEGDGYRIVIDNTSLFTGVVVVSADGYDASASVVSDKWSFLVGTRQLQTLYFADAYGVNKINVSELVGESQDMARLVLSSGTSPSIPVNSISDLSGEFVDEDFFLVVCPDGYNGVHVFKNEVGVPKVFSDGFRTPKARLSPDGTLYVVNRDLNRVEVYYGADIRDGYGRSPDFWYNSSSTPGLLPGAITDLHLVPQNSLVCENASRIYVGTERGLTRIETCDLEDPDGYFGGQDGYGKSFAYTVAGSSDTLPGGGTVFRVLGGTATRVSSVHSDEELTTILVATDDGYGTGGGVTQVSLSGNRQISFISGKDDTLPSSRLRGVYGRRLSET